MKNTDEWMLGEHQNNDNSFIWAGSHPFKDQIVSKIEAHLFTYDEAVNKIHTVNQARLNNLDTWRLPTIEELRALYTSGLEPNGLTDGHCFRSNQKHPDLAMHYGFDFDSGQKCLGGINHKMPILIICSLNKLR
ncbi:DUF1566 domain-containing protein [Thiomicrospira sp. ALE5]|uniref:DUF1566 domain-containing protein n=1 Tax=Thiomicrospira sp. ALE5 TaxID=748650 RepID=UPI0008F31575|nr:DUF1566 domain-containing protein [Thiomicrospira sp. ALE5]SFR52889.1 Protein of unknown function [Thiomicrospira sp. ALE5]